MKNEIKEQVRSRYARAARSAGPESTCCGEGQCCDPVTRDLYTDEETDGIPRAAVAASLGCGNPTALAELAPGEVVLDLGSGGGIDVLMSARRVGVEGRAIGLDMTDEMLELARANAREAGVTNVEFLKGDIEQVPLPDNSVDVIISNCVVNLSPDKRAAMQEAFRVLKPGGRLAISDIVTRGEISDSIRQSMELWTGCIAGALDADEFCGVLEEAGFSQVSVEDVQVYEFDDALNVLNGVPGAREVAGAVDGRFRSAFVRGRKPL